MLTHRAYGIAWGVGSALLACSSTPAQPPKLTPSPQASPLAEARADLEALARLNTCNARTLKDDPDRFASQRALDHAAFTGAADAKPLPNAVDMRAFVATLDCASAEDLARLERSDPYLTVSFDVSHVGCCCAAALLGHNFTVWIDAEARIAQAERLNLPDEAFALKLTAIEQATCDDTWLMPWDQLISGSFNGVIAAPLAKLANQAQGDARRAAALDATRAKVMDFLDRQVASVADDPDARDLRVLDAYRAAVVARTPVSLRAVCVAITDDAPTCDAMSPQELDANFGD